MGGNARFTGVIGGVAFRKPSIGVIVTKKWGILTGARVTKTCLIKAMSNWQLGQYRTALVDWIEAYELIQAKLEQGLDLGIRRSAVFPGIGAPEELESPWYDWVVAGLLMRECDEVIAQSEHMLDSRPEHDVVAGDSVTSLARALGEWHAIRGESGEGAQAFRAVTSSCLRHERPCGSSVQRDSCVEARGRDRLSAPARGGSAPVQRHD